MGWSYGSTTWHRLFRLGPHWVFTIVGKSFTT